MANTLAHLLRPSVRKVLWRENRVVEVDANLYLELAPTCFTDLVRRLRHHSEIVKLRNIKMLGETVKLQKVNLPQGQPGPCIIKLITAVIYGFRNKQWPKGSFCIQLIFHFIRVCNIWYNKTSFQKNLIRFSSSLTIIESILYIKFIQLRTELIIDISYFSLPCSIKYCLGYGFLEFITISTLWWSRVCQTLTHCIFVLVPSERL
jgi:hypothetical protein